MRPHLTPAFRRGAVRIALLASCLVLTGCFTVNLTSHPAFAPIVGKPLTTQRPCLLTIVTLPKPIGGGGEKIFSLGESPRDYAQRKAEGLYQDSIEVPVGTELRVDRVVRENQIDHGIAIDVYGAIRNPRTGRMERFVHRLSADLGSAIERAPWEDSSVPEFRALETTGIRDFKIGAPVPPPRR